MLKSNRGRIMIKILFRVVVLVFGLGLYLSACTEEQLSADELKKLFPDSTQTGIGRKTDEGVQEYWLYKRKDGTMNYKFQDGWMDEGSWRVTNDGRSCTTFKKLRKGKERCSTIFRIGDDKYKVLRPDGSANEFSLEVGNVRGL